MKADVCTRWQPRQHSKRHNNGGAYAEIHDGAVRIVVPVQRGSAKAHRVIPIDPDNVYSSDIRKLMASKEIKGPVVDEAARLVKKLAEKEWDLILGRT